MSAGKCQHISAVGFGRPLPGARGDQKAPEGVLPSPSSAPARCNATPRPLPSAYQPGGKWSWHRALSGPSPTRSDTQPMSAGKCQHISAVGFGRPLPGARGIRRRPRGVAPSSARDSSPCSAPLGPSVLTAISPATGCRTARGGLQGMGPPRHMVCCRPPSRWPAHNLDHGDAGVSTLALICICHP